MQSLFQNKTATDFKITFNPTFILLNISNKFVYIYMYIYIYIYLHVIWNLIIVDSIVVLKDK